MAGKADVVSGWIWSHHLLPFLQLLSHYAGYAFDGADWTTVEAGVEGADDAHADGWYSYRLTGDRAHLEVALAHAAGSDILMVGVAGADDPELRLRVDTLISAYASV
jgi:hypothetical protein